MHSGHSGHTRGALEEANEVLFVASRAPVEPAEHLELERVLPELARLGPVVAYCFMLNEE
jgi:hypothetical protein